MLRAGVIVGVLAAVVLSTNAGVAGEEGREAKDPGSPRGSALVRAGQTEVVRIAREVADLNAILQAQKALIDYRDEGGDPEARLDGRLCLESVLRPLCEALGQTFALGGER